MYCQPLEWTVHVLFSLKWTVHALSAFRMDSACAASIQKGQCMYCQSLEWTVHLLLSFEFTVHALSAFRMDSASLPEFRTYSACTVILWNGQCMYCQTLDWTVYVEYFQNVERTVHVLSAFRMNSPFTGSL